MRQLEKHCTNTQILEEGKLYYIEDVKVMIEDLSLQLTEREQEFLEYLENNAIEYLEFYFYYNSNSN